MSFNLDIPLWITVLFLAALFIPLILSSVGIYYLISNKFNGVTITISAIILLSIVMFTILNSWSEPMELNLIILGFPLSLFASSFPGTGITLLFSLVGIAFNYFALFSVVNFAQRIFTKVNS